MSVSNLAIVLVGGLIEEMIGLTLSVGLCILGKV